MLALHFIPLQKIVLPVKISTQKVSKETDQIKLLSTYKREIHYMNQTREGLGGLESNHD